MVEFKADFAVVALRPVTSLEFRLKENSLYLGGGWF